MSGRPPSREPRLEYPPSGLYPLPTRRDWRETIVLLERAAADVSVVALRCNGRRIRALANGLTQFAQLAEKWSGETDAP